MTNYFSYFSGFWNIEVKVANKSFNFIWRKWNKLINPRSFQPRILSILIRYNVQIIKTVKFWHDKIFFMFFRLLKYWGKKANKSFNFIWRKWNKKMNPRSFQPRILSILIRYKVQIIKIVKFWHEKYFLSYFSGFWNIEVKIANKCLFEEKWNKLTT